MDLRRFFIGEKYDAELRYPSRLEEIFRPGRAARMWDALEAAEEVVIFHEAEEEDRDRAYLRYADRCEYSIQKGNPPDSRELDAEIERAAERFPDAAGYCEANGEYERAGAQMGEDYYTQPVGSERHRAAHREYLEATRGSMEGWTAEQEYAADNWAELEYDRWQERQEDIHLAEGEAEPEAEQLEYWESPDREPEPDRRGELHLVADPGLSEPDPYDPLHLPSYSYWQPAREAADL